METSNPSRKPEQRLTGILKIILCIPAVITAIQALTGNLTVNPIQAAIQRSGQMAVILLALTLSITPLRTYFGWRFLAGWKKILGLSSFFYAASHFLLFLVLDYGFDLQLILNAVLQKPYILVGLLTLLMLTALAVTSNQWSKRRLGLNWKKLHRLVYLAGPLAGLHFAWALKGNLFQLSGNIFWPVIYLVIVCTLLVLRIPWVRHTLAGFFTVRSDKPPAG